MKSEILRADGIGKCYGKNTVLSELSIHIKQGEIYGLIGKNGSGKTTLLRILAGLIPRYSGRVDLDCRVSAVIGTPALFLNMTAYENMKAQSILLGIRDDDEIGDVLSLVGLSEHENKCVCSFSMGMTQRLRIGTALLARPEVLILDEPLNGLDPDGIAGLRELLHSLNREGLTIIISSHILSELEHTASRFGILSGHKISKELSVRDICESGVSLESAYLKYTEGEGR